MTVITALVVVYAMEEFGDLDAGLGFPRGLLSCRWSHSSFDGGL